MFCEKYVAKIVTSQLFMKRHTNIGARRCIHETGRSRHKKKKTHFWITFNILNSESQRRLLHYLSQPQLLLFLISKVQLKQFGNAHPCWIVPPEVLLGPMHIDVRRISNICALLLLIVFWLDWAGCLAVIGLNFLAQLSDRIHHKKLS